MARSGPVWLGAVAALAAVVGGCGGSDSGSGAEGAPAAEVETVEGDPVTVGAPEGSVGALLADNPAEDQALIFGAGDFAVGANRIPFLVVDGNGELVLSPRRGQVRVAKGGLDAIPDLETTAENVPVGVPAEAESTEGDFDAPSVWVVNLELDEPGQYTLLVEPEGGTLQAYGQIDVAEQPKAPAVGTKAFPSDTPTIEDGFAEDITTARPPDVKLLQHSVKESIADGVPFVVTFATPEFCESRVCGPVVDIVEGVRAKLESSGVRFIHVEVFEKNDPQLGVNRWMQEWNLPSEPWTFLVDERGVIQGRFEGLITSLELEQAVRDALM